MDMKGIFARVLFALFVLTIILGDRVRTAIESGAYTGLEFASHLITFYIIMGLFELVWSKIFGHRSRVGSFSF